MWPTLATFERPIGGNRDVWRSECLVKAIARRLKYDVQTFDQRFPS